MDIVLKNSTNIVTTSDFTVAKSEMQGFYSTGDCGIQTKAGFPYLTGSLQVNSSSITMYSRAITGFNLDPYLYGSSFGPPVLSGLFASGACAVLAGDNTYTTASSGPRGASFAPITPS